MATDPIAVEQPEAEQLTGGPSPIRMPGETFGQFAQRLNAWLETPRGMDYAANEQRHRTAEVARYHAERKLRLAGDMGIPERFRYMGDPANVPVDTAAMRAVKSPPGEMLILSGGTGCGKTAAACWWLYQSPGGGDRPQSLFVTGARLSRMSRFDDEAMAAVFGAHRLVIDDLAVEYADDKGFFHSLLDEIINERYAGRRQTLITTHLDVDAFRARCGARIIDRIRECGHFVSISDPTMRAPL